LRITEYDCSNCCALIGQDSSASATSRYFPPGAPQSINLPTFLNTLSNLLAPLSSQEELLNAFSAFDDDDSGQIDLDELRDALLHTSPEAGESPLTEREIDDVVNGFTGKKAFGKRGMKSGGGGRRGDVFYYQEFVGGITGGTESGEKGEVDAH
jgi:Ca2+-binding EF-hand superfamily protein